MRLPWFCLDQGCYGVVARGRQTHRLVSFVVGTTDRQLVIRNFYRRNLAALVPITIERLATSAKVRQYLRSQVLAALRLPAGGSKRSANPVGQPAARLLGIATAREYRGTGASAMVLASFEDEVRQAGHSVIGCSTKPWNQRAATFFQRHGWQESTRNDAGIFFARKL
ncbi:MAG: GNAT family N-acetyltransferase [Pirellulales bacterium]|nr:GNAT family N-acetyltransferase [Pirellulales bacterium]